MVKRTPQPSITNLRVATLAYWQISRVWYLSEGLMTTQHALQTLGAVKGKGAQITKSADSLLMQIVHKNAEPSKKAIK